MNATDPNMKPFFAHNGKLLIYQGFADPQVSPFQTISYYENVFDNLGGASKSTNNVRLFLAPGMGHCGGGVGHYSLRWLFPASDNPGLERSPSAIRSSETPSMLQESNA